MPFFKPKEEIWTGDVYQPYVPHEHVKTIGSEHESYRSPVRFPKGLCRKCGESVSLHGVINASPSHRLRFSAICPGTWVIQNKETNEFRLVEDKHMQKEYQPLVGGWETYKPGA